MGLITQTYNLNYLTYVLRPLSEDPIIYLRTIFTDLIFIGNTYMKEKLQLIMNAMLITFNLSGLGIGSYWAYSATVGYESPYIIEETLRKPASLPEEFEKTSNIYTMDKFIVNLSGQPRRTIRLQVNLDMMSARSFTEIMESDKTAKARDRIIRLLNDKTYSDLESIQGKLFLKDKIVEEVNKVLTAGLVKDVYFTDFVIN